MNFIGGSEFIADSDGDSEFFGGGETQSLGSLVGGDYFSDNESQIVGGAEGNGNDIDFAPLFESILQMTNTESVDNLNGVFSRFVEHNSNEELKQWCQDTFNKVTIASADLKTKKEELLKIACVIYVYSHDNLTEDDENSDEKSDEEKLGREYSLNLREYKKDQSSPIQLSLQEGENITIKNLIKHIQNKLAPPE